ncbi:MAG: hypothetical protein JWR90_2876 [Marmoricola sp.]|jgi:uncharacterized protein (TIGR02453 family)|nr:hypothetical protein [Marmoricola sp.]
MNFEGFPDTALDFYDDLELDNTKSFWEAHKHVYESAVRLPMLALTAALAEEFGAAKVFRPYRDVRFAKDKTPYKNHQGAIVQVGAATGYYVQVGSPGVSVSGGYYHAGGPDLARIRTAIDVEHSGAELARIVAALEADGFTIRGDQLKTTPRGYTVDHPRIDLLRYKSMSMTKSYGFENLDTPDLLDRVRADWRALRPLVDWVRARVDVIG